MKKDEQTLLCRVCGERPTIVRDGEQWVVDGTTYRLAECPLCCCVCTAPLPTDTVLNQLYANGFDYRWYRDHLWAKKRDARIRYKEYESQLGASVLDFGGGLGYFSAICRRNGRTSVTYDPFAQGGDYAETSRKFDTVVALHMLEHSNDVCTSILQMRSLLKTGGTLILAVPNYKGNGYRHRGMRWVWAQPPLIHVYHFTADGLIRILSRYGFSEFSVSYHERWDANLYCDLDNAPRFERLDGMWARQPYSRFSVYRKAVAALNSLRRFFWLQRFAADRNVSDDSLSELQITAKLSV